MSDLPFDYRENHDHLTEALRMSQINADRRSVFPHASMPLAWSHAQTLALADIAVSLREIATHLRGISEERGRCGRCTE